MPALPFAAKTIKLLFNFDVRGDVGALTGIYETYTGTAPTVTELEAFCSAVGTAWDANMASLMGATGGSLELVTGTDLSSATSAQAEAAAVFAGTRSGAELPSDVSMVIGYEVARRFRGGHARGYWPLGVETDLLTGQEWTTTFVSACTAGFVGMQAAIAAAGWSGAGTIAQANVSYFEGFTVVTSPTTHRARNVPTPRAAAVIDPVTAVIARPLLGTQRRRIHRLR